MRAMEEVVTELAGASRKPLQSFKLKPPVVAVVLLVVVVVVVEGVGNDDAEAKRIEVGGERMKEGVRDGEQKGEEEVASSIVVERLGFSGEGLRKFASRLVVADKSDDDDEGNERSKNRVADGKPNGGKGVLGVMVVVVDAYGKGERAVVGVAVQV